MSPLLQARVGGLNAMSHQGQSQQAPPQQSPNTAMMAQGSQASQAYLDKRFEQLPSMMEAARVAREQYNSMITDEGYGQRESQWYDNMSPVEGIEHTTIDPSVPGQFLPFLQQMARGSANNRQRDLANEYTRADRQASSLTKAAGDEEKRLLDAQTRQQKMGAVSQGKWVPSPKEPGVFVNNATGERKAISDADALAIRDITGKVLDKYDTPQDALDAATQLHFKMMPQGAATPFADKGTPVDATVRTPADDTQESVLTSKNTTGPIISYDISKLSPSDRLQAKKLIDRFETRPSDNLGEATVKMLSAMGAVEQTDSTESKFPKVRDKAAEAGEKKLAEERAKLSVDTVKSATPGTSEYEKRENEVVEKITGFNAMDRVVARLDDMVNDLKADPNLEKGVGVYDANTPTWAALPTNMQKKEAIKNKIAVLKEFLETKGLGELRSSGVAPGSVTEKEWGKFASMVSSITPSSDEKEFMSQLNKLKELSNTYARESGLKKEAAKRQYGDLWVKHQSLEDKPKSFDTEAAAEAANLPKGTKVIINGRSAIVE